MRTNVAAVKLVLSRYSPPSHYRRVSRTSCADLAVRDIGIINVCSVVQTGVQLPGFWQYALLLAAFGAVAVFMIVGPT